MSRILVDMDDVIAKCVQTWINIINEKKKLAIDFEEATDWSWSKIREKYSLSLDEMLEVLDEKDFFINLPRVKGSKRALQELKDSGWEIVIVTTLFPWNRDSGTKANHKQIWLDLHFKGILEPRNIIMTERKDLIEGDVLIDDAPKYLIPYPGNVIVFDRPWNRNIPELEGMKRAKDWKKIVEICRKLQ